MKGKQLIQSVAGFGAVLGLRSGRAATLGERSSAGEGSDAPQRVCTQTGPASELRVRVRVRRLCVWAS